ncbi:DUF3280 domain-containing protein [Methylobacterium sp. J-076]|uniref:DUF3280 domain-containing protein n=1 Tax=Methylobacterium sp. J-076 TaxID=2836655 RepID=UPI001FB8F3A9|nr:DUF3280 domain-containing protein [Methylobacterium sp. J-076]MCJ2013977.1 DUF3280 domain-containing protein [Methylobacterium sp. J-076]
MRPTTRLLAALAGLAAAGWTGAAIAATEKAAVFPIELHDPSAAYGSRLRPLDAKKLTLVTDELRTSLKSQGGLDVIDTAPAAKEVEQQGPLYKCNGCAGDIAKGLGADLVVTGYAERGANQIFNLNVTIAEVGTGKLIRGGQVTIRADDDNTWAHAMRWLVKNRLLAEPLPTKQ